jgi:hypothetical protein
MKPVSTASLGGPAVPADQPEVTPLGGEDRREAVQERARMANVGRSPFMYTLAYKTRLLR